MTGRGPVVRATTDPVAFAALVAPLVEADPVRLSVLATNLAARTARPEPGDLWLWVEQDGRPGAAAMLTVPRGLHLAFADRPDAADALADHLDDLGGVVPAVTGWRSSVERFVARWCGLRPVRATTAMDQAAHLLGTLSPPSGVPGSSRTAATSDLGVLDPWADAFARETATGAPPSAPRGGWLDTHVAERRLRVHEVDGVPVSMACGSAPHGGVVRVSWVFTPAEHRRHGYAAACVADVAARAVRAGHRVMLYTDLANPTSNGVYARIGFAPAGEAVQVAFDPAT